jgi:chromosome segregation ATPase
MSEGGLVMQIERQAAHVIESLRAALVSAETSEAAWEIESDKWKARAEKAEARIAELEKDRDNLRAALDAADRLAEMVRQHAAQNAGYDASSDITTGDIGQEYEFYQSARAAVGKAGGD